MAAVTGISRRSNDREEMQSLMKLLLKLSNVCVCIYQYSRDPRKSLKC